MQLQVISFVLIMLHYMDSSGSQPHSSSRHPQHKAISGVGSGCQQGGCLTCSDYNGCLSCKPRFFMHLKRIGMKQIGVCMTSCPPGFYGTRSPERNTCTKCRSECDSCFDKNFCTRCRVGFYLHLGKCQESCPDGMVPNDTQRECVPSCPSECELCGNSETCTRCKHGLFLLNGRCYRSCPEDYEPTDKMMECTPQVHCEVSEWTEWSPCLRISRACNQLGQETRTRRILQTPSPYGRPCPLTMEVKNCLVKRKKCPGKLRNPDRKGKKPRKNRKDKESDEVRRERRRQERDRNARERENAENRNKTEPRHRKGHDSAPSSPERRSVQ